MNFSTTWCQSCKIHEAVNFKSKVLADIINENFIPVKFDGASADSVTFFGNKFMPAQQYQPHQLVQAYMKTSYQMPATLFINSSGQLITEIHGFIPPAPFEIMLNYFASKAYTTTKYDDYRAGFVNKIKY